ncbi:MAG TPA: bacillithiol biosynthesis cysteine-adding enzyme BshC [Chitinophagaceae bacterium]
MHSRKTTAPSPTAEYIPYADTGFFSRMVIDYLQQDKSLRNFYRYEPDLAGIRQAIEDRQRYHYDRDGLVNALSTQYEGLTTTDAVRQNIELLKRDSCFAITTAHQPNIFTGPLYFVYKIIHAIKLAEYLKQQLPENDFVPVFFMGSEDADLDELGHCVVDSKRYEWKTRQQGAVGRMKVDKAFVSLLDELAGQLQVLPYGEAIIRIFRDCYQPGESIQQATLRLVNHLFGDFGLVVLVPDNPALKAIFQPVIEKELKEQFSHTAVAGSIDQLGERYKVQAGGRELNLFYLIDDKRERIGRYGDVYRVNGMDRTFTETEILAEATAHPERFSPNVILRGVFQEMILPGIAFIGGGGEIAYWLELKRVFEAVQVPFPVLLLRNSFLLMTTDQHEILNSLGFQSVDLFQPADILMNRLTKAQSSNRLSLSEEIGELNSFYQQLHETAKQVDQSLAEHVNALQAKALKPVAELEKKMLRAEKRKFETANRKIVQLKHQCFPGEGLQERVENIAGFYARFGKEILYRLYEHSPALEQHFTVLTL